jgi:hypothetical protein
LVEKFVVLFLSIEFAKKIRSATVIGQSIFIIQIWNQSHVGMLKISHAVLAKIIFLEDLREPLGKFQELFLG